MKITCVCSKCGNNESEQVVIEINFRDGKLYWFCPKCKTMNDLVLRMPTPPALPRTKRMGM